MPQLQCWWNLPRRKTCWMALRFKGSIVLGASTRRNAPGPVVVTFSDGGWIAFPNAE